MDKQVNIVIVHSSEIILTGLAEIISNCSNNKIIIVKNINDLPNYPNIMGYHLVILTELYLSENKNLLNRVFRDTSQVKYFPIQETFSGNDINSIKIDDSSIDICLKINDILSSFQKQKKDENKHELSQRETEVLKLITKGLTNKEIASMLFISPHTVVTHRKNITEKLNIKSISGLTVYAVMKKIINIEEINPDELI